MTRLLDDVTLRTAMGQAASQRAKERFGAGRLASDIGNLYEALASRLALATDRDPGVVEVD